LVAEGINREGAFRIEEGIGPVDVVVERHADGLRATFTVRQAPDIHREAADIADAAAAIGLRQVDVVRTFAGTLGPDFTFIQLRDAETVDRAALDYTAWTANFAGRPGAQLYLFSGEITNGAHLYVRMFGPAFGIPEDPATGSAAAVIAGAGALFSQAAEPSFGLTIDQGVLMGRPSRLEAEATLSGGKVVAVSVGGATTFVAEGEINVPERYLLG
jgi:trans-2,3-dihydro-3-hydroxyanthranilate isomerase